MENLIEYSRRNGYYINSKKLSEYLGCKHNDLIRRIQRFHKRYIPYKYESNPFAKGGKIKIWVLKYAHLENLRIPSDLKEGLRKILSEKEEKMRKEIYASLSRLFGGTI